MLFKYRLLSVRPLLNKFPVIMGNINVVYVALAGVYVSFPLYIKYVVDRDK